MIAALVAWISPSRACDPEMFRLAVDIGHTAAAPGATSARGRGEYAFNVDVARAVVAGLRAAGFARTVLLEDHGAIVALADRTDLAARLGADLLLSVHHDSVQERFLAQGVLEGEQRTFSRHAAGHSLFVAGSGPWAAGSLSFARALGDALLARGLRPSLHHAEDVAGERRQLLDARRGIYRWDGLYVLRASHGPAVLFEVGVIKHPEEELRLGDPAAHAQVAAAVVEAAQSYCTNG